MKLQFNQAPYYDDFSANAGYQKVLFKPAHPVQGRELNAIQSILSNQIGTFANHIFKNGSKVSNARSSFLEYDYVRLRAETPNTNEPVNVEIFREGTRVRGEVSKIEAILIMGANAENDDPATIFVTYTKTAIDGKTKTFIPGENIEYLDENDVVVYKTTVRCPSCPGSNEDAEIAPTGKGHIYIIDEGTFYFEGMFINNARQKVIVNKYSKASDSDYYVDTFKGAKVGFDFRQSIVTAEEDQSLLDPSLGYPNAMSPGADRYKTELVLTKRSLDSQDGESFLLLARINKFFVMEYMKSDSDYADIMDTIAKRNYETHGNYTIRPFKLSFYEHYKKDKADATGYDLNGDKNNLVALLTPSVAYVRGFRVETIADMPIVIKKARDTAKLNSFIRWFPERASITLKPKTHNVYPGHKDDTSLTGKNTVAIFDEADGAGTQIGTCRINDIELVSGKPDDLSAVYRYSIFDLKMNIGKTLADAKSFIQVDVGFNAEPVPDAAGKFEVKNADANVLVFPLDKTDVKSLRDSDNNRNGSLSIILRKKLKMTLDSEGRATFNTLTNEFFESISNSTICTITDSSNVSTTIKLDGNNSTVSPTSLTVDFGAQHSGKTVTILQDVLRTNQKEKKKTLVPLVHTTSTAPETLLKSKVMLGKADAYKLKFVHLYDHQDPSSPVMVEDITENYKLVQNSDDWFYKESYIELVKEIGRGVSGNYRLHISFEYFEHSGTEGFFTADSYSDVVNDPDNNFNFDDIPKYKTTAGQEISLNSAFDFRSVLMAGETTGYVPAQKTTAIFDVEYYLPRADIIQINKDGRLYVKYGTPSESPALPTPDEDAMVLYHVFLDAYTYTLNDVRSKFIENKRFTMRDIGRLETRIENLEYYTTLTLLEQSAKDLSIKDSNGLDRFKNGLVVDNFSDFQAGDLGNLEWKAAIDTGHKQLRPQFKASNYKLNVNKGNSQNVKWHGHFATLPYTTEEVDGNPFATKHLSINPYFIFAQKGQVVLSPNIDTWSDETRRPEVVRNMDVGMDAMRQLATASGLLGTRWGSWTTQNSTTVVSNSATAVTTTTTEVQTRTGVTTTLESRTQSWTIEDVVKDVQIIPYTRSRRVEFFASGLRPNTRMFVFFDKQPVSEFCRDIGFVLTDANAGTRTESIAYGSPMYTNANGEIRGEFLIPAGRFFTGKSEFKITDDEKGGEDADQETSYAVTTYFSGGLDVTKQNHTLNLETPVLSNNPVSDSRTNTSVVSRPVPPPAPRPPVRNTWFPAPDRRDPIAQSFTLETDRIITQLDVYFKEVDLNAGNIWMEIRTMDNGYPGVEVLAHKEYAPKDVIKSEDASKPHSVVWDVPVYLKGKTEYCFIIGGASPNTRAWVSRLGQEVIGMPGKIVETQPTLGSSFRSQNNTTWNAEQYEDIKYTLHAAIFEEQPLILEFENDAEGAVSELPVNPLEMQAGSDMVRVFIPDHGLSKDDKIALSLFEGNTIQINCPALPPQIGQTLRSATGTGKIKEIVKDGAIAGDYIVTLEAMTGKFIANQAWVADAMLKQFRDNILVSWISSDLPTMMQINECHGTFRQDSTWGNYIGGKINGIPVDVLNGEHTVKLVDSLDSLIIQVSEPANNSGRSGGTEIKVINTNRRYDTLNVSGSYMAYAATESWNFSGIGHGEAGGIFEGDNYAEMKELQIAIATDHNLPQPFKMATPRNEQRVFGPTGRKSVKLTATMKSPSAYISPIVNCDSFSLTAIANRVEELKEDRFNVEPNADNRFVPETDPLLGSAPFKYVTRLIQLANSASDLIIYFDAYKDINADFEVYVKTIPVYNAKPADEYPWVPVKIEGKRDSADLTDLNEMKIKCSEGVDGWQEGFNAFKVKIVGKTKNTAKPPLFEKFRAIAVT